MKKHKIVIGIGLFVATLLGALTISRGNAFAATKTWDGGGADDKFSTGANWDGDTAPANGDSLVFPMDTIFSGDCSADLTFNNDLDSNSILFQVSRLVAQSLVAVTVTSTLQEIILNYLVIFRP